MGIHKAITYPIMETQSETHFQAHIQIHSQTHNQVHKSIGKNSHKYVFLSILENKSQ